MGLFPGGLTALLGATVSLPSPETPDLVLFTEHLESSSSRSCCIRKPGSRTAPGPQTFTALPGISCCATSGRGLVQAH